MIEKARAMLRAAPATMRSGLAVGGEDMVVAALVAAPFAATFGVWLAWATWWPNPAIWAVAALAEAAGAAWTAGRMRALAEGTE